MSQQVTEEDEANVFADTGWFMEDATVIPSPEDLAALQKNVGDTGALEAPSHWAPVADPSVMEQHVIKQGDSEYDKVIQAFMSTLGKRNITILKVERVQNLAMWQSYVVKRQTICNREIGMNSGTTSPIEKKKVMDRFERSWLWHGSNLEVKDKILQQGFNRSFCGKNATVYGKCCFDQATHQH